MVWKIVVCASGGGGNFQALIDSQDALSYKISLLIVDRNCGAMDRASKFGIACKLLTKKSSSDEFFMDMDKEIGSGTDLIVLAGFMPILSPSFCEKWKGKIINTHPSLLPKFGGKGMYGVKVQEAVMRAKESHTGCSVHYVNHLIDGGEIILQKSIKVDYEETPWELGGRVFKEENKLLVKAVDLVLNKENKGSLDV
jgi:phosphoribosylglycinamide formyltransferase 1